MSDFVCSECSGKIIIDSHYDANRCLGHCENCGEEFILINNKGV